VFHLSKNDAGAGPHPPKKATESRSSPPIANRHDLRWFRRLKDLSAYAAYPGVVYRPIADFPQPISFNAIWRRGNPKGRLGAFLATTRAFADRWAWAHELHTLTTPRPI
jgi:hypothetical protein